MRAEFGSSNVNCLTLKEINQHNAANYTFDSPNRVSRHHPACMYAGRTYASGVHVLYYEKLLKKKVDHMSVTLLGNILLRSIVVSVLIRLINGYSVTDGT